MVTDAPENETSETEDHKTDPKKKSRRRSVRGRRSSIKIVTEGSSPAFIAAPLSESVVNNENVSPIAQLEKKRDTIIAYKAVLQDEVQDWKSRIEKEDQLLERAKRIAERGIERKRSVRTTVDSAGRGNLTQRPRYIMNRVVRTFIMQNEDLHNQKLLDEHLTRLAKLKDILAKKKREQELALALLKAEPQKELLTQKQYWDHLKEQEEARITQLQAKLKRLEVREALLEYL